MILPRRFYSDEVNSVARKLLGKKLVHIVHGTRISGIINETEAYDGEKDLACHARNGKTTRNAVMYGSSGIAYIYFTYGLHWMLNCVCGKEGYPAAVLIRSVVPIEGLCDIQEIRSPIPKRDWTNGPAKLAKAFSINGSLNGVDLTRKKNNIWIEYGMRISEQLVFRTPRIGIENTPEPWKSKSWRYFVKPVEIKPKRI